MSANSSPHAAKRVLLQVELEDKSDGAADKLTTQAVNWVFPGETLTVGRSAALADFSIEADSAMSKRHFQVHFDGEACYLVDLGSFNGTRVNGRQVSDSTLLNDGDEILAGNTVLSVAIVGRDADKAPTDDPQTTEIPAGDPVALPHQAEGTPAPRIVTLKLLAETGPQPVSRLMAWIRAGQSIHVGSSGHDAEWMIPEEWEVSPLHFRVTFDGVVCTLCNQDSRRGTLLNGKPVSQAQLSNGDTISAGQASFLVEMS